MPFVVAYRFADTEQRRPRHRITIDYRMTSNFHPGLEYNPAADEIGIRATWVVQTENPSRPMIHLNTSSDRIGTPEGYQQVSANLSKTIEGTGVAPYIGVTYSGFEKGLVFPFGVSYSPSPNWNIIGMNDGRKSHLLISLSQRDTFVQLGWIWFERLSFTIGWGF